MLLHLVTGCASSPTASRASANKPIDRINLICRPVAVNFDKTPGADGIGVTLYASSPAEPKTVRVTAGTVQVMLFEGLLKAGDLTNATPFWSWTYTAQDLKPLAFAGSIGICYPLGLRWGNAKPQQDHLTVIARYTPPDGPMIQSQPNVIAMVVQ